LFQYALYLLLSDILLQELLENVDLEKLEFLLQIRTLKKEISSLSSCSLAKEKENLRKDIEKTKAKLKETDFKLKNAIQEKTKLEVSYYIPWFLYVAIKI
jgi:centromeric protein E